MARYRMLPNVGPHKQAGVVYRSGQIVANDADLVKLFPGKFEYVDGDTVQDTGEDPERAEAGTYDPEPRRSRRPAVIEPQSEPGDEGEGSEEPLEELEEGEEAPKERPAAKKKKR